MKNGSAVRDFEKAFAEYVGARWAVGLCNGTATLHTALVALGVKPGDKVATTPLTMSATSIAILQAGGVPHYVDVDPKTWIMANPTMHWAIPISLYGLHQHWSDDRLVDDAAQTLRRHNSKTAFTSYSFQASKILALGEGGMLVTDSEELATKAREFSSLGYRMKADQPRIDPSVLKSPDYERHHSMGWNYRMNDLTAEAGLRALQGDWFDGHEGADILLKQRHECAHLYREAILGCDWITPQFVPSGWTHDYWTFAIALESKELWKPFTEAIVRHGGEMPYGAWRLTYHEPAFRHLRPTAAPTNNRRLTPDVVYGTWLPIAESLQPRLVQFQTNDLASAERNAKAVKEAIKWLDVASRQRKAFEGWNPIPLLATLKPMPSADATGTPCS